MSSLPPPNDPSERNAAADRAAHEPDLTPQQLRERAWKSLQTARLVAEADPDVAAREAALAGEFALKAHYCARHGHTVFPGTKAGRIALGIPARILTHDLEQLLRLTDDYFLTPDSIGALLWERITNWRGDWRYVPVGTVSTDRALEQIAATESLFLKLLHMQAIEGLWRTREVLSSQHASINFLGLTQTPNGRWTVRVAVWAQVKNLAAAHEHWRRIMNDTLAPDIVGWLAGSEMWDASHPQIQHCMAVAGPMSSWSLVYLKGNFVPGTETPPPTYVLFSDPSRPLPLLIPPIGLGGTLTNPLPRSARVDG